jgi:hypothetical protein
MPTISVIIPYCMLQIFVFSHTHNAMELASEGNPRSRLFKITSGIGMIGLYGFVPYNLIFVDPWYFALILFALGLIVNAVVTTVLRGTRSTKLTVGIMLLGFVGIPACMIALLALSL